MDNTDKKDCLISCLTTRRQFLFLSGAATATIMLTGIPGLGAKEVQAVVSKYPRVKIGKLSALKQDMPVAFTYPTKDIRNILVKLGTPAGGGVGSNNDVVAFNPVCTHMGGPMETAYKAEYKILGQCPFHQSTFDLTRHGMIISGHATESLPQILLETEGDDIYAAGVIGLVFGRNSNV
ncbi:MAG: arsenite oxidase small subunit [Deltaproteobacteria bacterium GWC2_42_11]|nr:MAG: arsenite oxidase small subunit [Deltaproteobacteria bacterium GWC2_42_11]HBO83498.1 arsenate reductase (azurin) small subunit [Deltaproteobacteria bacterium]